MGKVWIRLLIAFLATALPGCTSRGNPTGRKPGTVRAFVSIPPQACFVERIGGGRVNVSVLVQPGQSPATYEPTPKQMALLSRADVYFRVGLPFETALLEKLGATHSSLNVVDTRAGIPLRDMAEHHHGGSHDCRHDHGAKDPHIWLDPLLVKVQARTICRELARLDAVHAQEFEANLSRFESELDEVHASVAQTLAPLKGRRFYVFHPAFGYFADRYGLEQRAVEIAGKEPSARQLAQLTSKAREEGVNVIFVQREFSTKSAQAIAQSIDGAVVRMDPLARDYLNNLKTMAARIEAGLGR